MTAEKDAFRQWVDELEERLVYAKAEADYYRSLAERVGQRALRETSRLSRLVEELKGTRAALMESEARYRRLVDNAPEAIFRWRLGAGMEYISPSITRITGYTPEEMAVDQALCFRLGAVGAEDVKRDFVPIPGGSVSGRREVRFIRKDGSEAFLEVRSMPVKDAEGYVTALEGIVIDITRIKNTEESLRSLSRMIITLQEEERDRLSRDLHDQLGQQLAGLAFQVEGLRTAKGDSSGKYLGTMEEIVVDMGRQIRRICKGLRPSILDNLGLAQAVETLAAEFREGSGRRVDLKIESPEAEDGSLAPGVAIHVYRILQEALTNVARHSGARRVEIIFRRDEKTLLLEIRDDGNGFQPGAAGGVAGFGLTGMKERAAMCGGRLEVKSEPGRGARVTLEIGT